MPRRASSRAAAQIAKTWRKEDKRRSEGFFSTVIGGITDAIWGDDDDEYYDDDDDDGEGYYEDGEASQLVPPMAGGLPNGHGAASKGYNSRSARAESAQRRAEKAAQAEAAERAADFVGVDPYEDSFVLPTAAIMGDGGAPSARPVAASPKFTI